MAVWNKPAAQWVVKTCYYLAILLGLLWIYGFNDFTAGNFIYTNF
ncbi:teichoic acid D-Ala incorporation-associated protein DltX [Thermanaerosceptrum fracticalcis]|jgi:hypothetical protein|uniref:Teichoic acid D-Ala incorporation-associated protein DltX n=1 Tax=Thermanaerosceptrum fracticalcis TaxID=1712410 RepID=A0A7G6E8U8_THEFR|nr:teichoic acid D-Ala incorporation-associated protein DltX [Thermanaerosceptrum fracticalcis]